MTVEYDPVAAVERYEAKLEAEVERLPVCCDCGEHIQQEDAVYMNGEWFCDNCISSYRRDVELEW